MPHLLLDLHHTYFNTSLLNQLTFRTLCIIHLLYNLKLQRLIIEENWHMKKNSNFWQWMSYLLTDQFSPEVIWTFYSTSLAFDPWVLSSL